MEGQYRIIKAQRPIPPVGPFHVAVPRVRLTRKELDVDGRAAVLSPGMAVTAEVVTGKRRVIDYLLSPVARATREAGRER